MPIPPPLPKAARKPRPERPLTMTMPLKSIARRVAGKIFEYNDPLELQTARRNSIKFY